MPGFLSPTRARLLAFLLLVSMAQLGTAVAAAGMVGELFRRMIAGEPAADGLSAILAGAIVVTACTEFGRRRLTEALGLDYAKSVRLALFERLIRRPVRGSRPRSKGSQLLPFVGDLTALRLWWADGMARGSSSAMIALGVIAWFFSTDLTLGAWFAGGTAATLAAMALIARPYFNATRRQRSRRGAMTALISDRIGAAHTVLGMGGVRRELNQTERRIDRMNGASLARAGWSGAMRGLVAAFPFASVLVLLHLAAAGAGTGNTIMHEFAGLLTLAGILSASIADLGRAIELAIPARIAGKRLRDRLAEVVPIERGEKTGRGKNAAIVGIDRLSLVPGSRGFTAELNPGDIVSLAGADAKGLVEVLAGLQPPPAGEVCIKGRPIIGLGQRQRRQWVGIAAPWVPLLLGQLGENLLFRMRQRDGIAELPKLMEQMGLSHLLDAGGTPIALRLQDQAHALSPADLAAIKLVRAMIGAPKLLLLDRAAQDLAPAQLTGLARIISKWRGVVVMTGEPQELGALCNRRWVISDNGIEDTGEESNVATVHPMCGTHGR
ncbi:ABC transporter ATP-binding protein [Parerythrobacter aestuarii]|uniref:ABC transporter ATP-binding protein n=1 Tax=Parerythrobacter aestuarii TaxID=3020909 RepID=UPI0024DE05E8|nr:ABC transporter ATP-binding protein [Parerythrobacter aestuarii]